MNTQINASSSGMAKNCPLRVPQAVMVASRCELTELPLNIIEGKLPDDLQGHIFIVAPAGSVDSGGLPYPDGTPIFNGDGMIYRLDFNAQQEAKITTRIAKTPCYYADAATKPGSEYEKYGFKNHGLTRFSMALGIRNQLNTAFLKFKTSEDTNDRLLVTYDAGRPYEIDTETLEVVTPMGANTEWRPEVSLSMPFGPILSTAHPVFDAETKEVFTVNYGRSIGNFMQTIPFIYDAEKLPYAIKQIIEAIAGFLNILKVIKFLLNGITKIIWEVFKWISSVFEKVFKIKMQNFVYLMRWNGSGNIERWKLVLPDRSPVVIHQSLHQIAVTRNYIVLIDTAFSVGMAQTFNNPLPNNKKTERLLRDFLSRPVSPESYLYIVRRDRLQNGQQPIDSKTEVEVVAQKLVIPMEILHFAADFEDSNGKITLHIGHICAADAGEWMREFDTLPDKSETPITSRLYGMQTEVMDVSRFGRYIIDVEKGEIIESQIISDINFTWGAELYTYCDFLPSGKSLEKIENIYWCSFGFWPELLTKFIFKLYKNYKYREVSNEDLLKLLDRQEGKPGCLLRLDTQEMKIADAFVFMPEIEADNTAEGYMINSPQFVPRVGGNGDSTDGYIVCTIYFKNSSEIWIFDANNLVGGPICKLGHPELRFGFTLHTTWLPKIAKRTATYNIPVEEDYQDLVAQQPAEIQELFKKEIYPHFESKNP